jgi:cation transport ATPase
VPGSTASSRAWVAATHSVRQNLVLAFGYNALGVPIAAGTLYPCSGDAESRLRVGDLSLDD